MTNPVTTRALAALDSLIAAIESGAPQCVVDQRHAVYERLERAMCDHVDALVRLFDKDWPR